MQVLAVLGLHQRLGQPQQLLPVDEAPAVSDLLDAGDVEPLPLLDDIDELGRLLEPLVCTGVQPGHAPEEPDDPQLFPAEVLVVDGGNLQFPPGGGLYVFGDLHHVIVVEIEAGDGEFGLGLVGFLLQGEDFSGLVELYHAELGGVVDGVAEDDGALLQRGGLLKKDRKAAAVEDIISQNQRHLVFSDEFFADDEGFGQTVGGLLDGVAETHPQLAAVSQNVLENRDILGGGDDEDIPDACQHQGGQGIVYHRFVVDGQGLLGNAFGDGIQPGAGAAGQDDAFHFLSSFLLRKMKSLLNR